MSTQELESLFRHFNLVIELYLNALLKCSAITDKELPVGIWGNTKLV